MGAVRRQRSSVGIPRVGDGGRRRLIRLRADDELKAMMHPPAAGAGGVLVVPSREAVGLGDDVTVEISLGPLVDEVLLRGLVQDVSRRGDRGPPLVTIEIRPSDAVRTRYVLDVLDGRRPASARNHRRVPAGIDVRWWWGVRARNHRVCSLSMGGAFIRCDDPPSPGFRTKIELQDDTRRGPIRVPARVVWQGEAAEGPGFGVKFDLPDPQTAQRLRALIDQLERVKSRTTLTPPPT